MDGAVALLIGQAVAERHLQDHVLARGKRVEWRQRPGHLGDVLARDLDAARLPPGQLTAGGYSDTVQPVADAMPDGLNVRLPTGKGRPRDAPMWLDGIADVYDSRTLACRRELDRTGGDPIVAQHQFHKCLAVDQQSTLRQ